MTPPAGLEVHEVDVDKLAAAVTMVGDVTVPIVPPAWLRAVARAVEPRARNEGRGVLLLHEEPSAAAVGEGAREVVRDVQMKLLVEPVADRHEIGIGDAMLVDSHELGMPKCLLPGIDVTVHLAVSPSVPEECEMPRDPVLMSGEDVVLGQQLVGIERSDVAEEQVEVTPTVKVESVQLGLVDPP